MSDASGGVSATVRGLRRAVAVAFVAALAIGGGLFWVFSDKSVVSTDDAYVAADKTLVSPLVRGMVVEVAARENQPIRAGDLLVKIDPEEYDLKIAQAQGDVLAARAAATAARAGLARLA